MKLCLTSLALVMCAIATAQPVVTNIAMVPRLTVHSDVGSTNQIEYSADLEQTNWTVLTNLVVIQSPYWFVDVSAPPAANRFYRVGAFTPTNLVPTNMALIPAGPFYMGDIMDSSSSALPVHTVTLGAFYMDKYEVTKALWDDVYQWATNHGYSFDNSGAGKAADHPVQSINWYDMVKWCNARSEMEGRTAAYYTSLAQTTVYRSGQLNVDNTWVKWDSSYRLPTEAEWEKAARGGDNGRRFPWQDAETITHSRANYISSANLPGGLYDISPTRGYHPMFATGSQPYTSPVGYFAPNGYGLFDMTGNISEVCWDWLDSGYYDSSSANNPDPRGPAWGTLHVYRGGGWGSNASFNRCAGDRFGNSPTYTNSVFGFRCVLPPSQP